MKATVSQPSATERVLEIEVPRERLDRIFDDKVKKYSREIRVNGFRPGNVPKQVIATRYKEPISAESLETLVDEAVKEACKQNSIEPVGPGKVEKLDNEYGKPVFVKVLIEVDPPVELKDYRFNIPLNPPTIDAAAVEASIQDIRRQIAQEAPVERAAQTGDVVASRYQKIQIGGQDQPLPQYPVFRAELGKGSIPELDKALIGVKAGETKEVSFTFPADYPNPSLANQTSSYNLLIEQVLEVKLPDVDDAFAKSVGYENVEDMKTQVKARMEESATRQAREAAWEEATRRLLDSHPLQIPKARVHNYVHHRLEEMGHHHKDGEGHDHDHSDLEREGEMQIRRWRLLDAIAQKENVKPTQEEVDLRIRGLAMRYGTDFESLKANLRKNGRIMDLREEVKAEKTLDLIIGFTPA
ncbi:MAG TPA: trigger factor [Fibrobacteres bacterium]|nr:trigger factor [Fibrobacterota bacterium]